jgi:hypothetical protein
MEVIDLLLECLQPLLVLLNKNQHRRLGGGRDLLPEFSRDRRRNLHAADLRTRSFQGKSSL